MSRFFNIYGPRQGLDQVIPKFILQALNDHDITIYGDVPARSLIEQAQIVRESLLSHPNISQVDIVLSDMAASSSGHKKTDHLRIIALCESAAHFAEIVLKPGGIFVAKVLAGGAEPELQKLLKKGMSDK